jgi:hypothetical protein
MVVAVIVLVVIVTVRFVVGIAVAAHAAAYFRFSGGGQESISQIRDFARFTRVSLA